MQIKETTLAELKSSRDEINNILVAHIQKQYGFKIESVTVDDQGVITFRGTKSKDMMAAELNHNGVGDLHLNGNGKEKRHYGPRKHLGLTKFLRDQLENGEKIHIDVLIEAANKNGFSVNQSLIQKYLRQGAMKHDITEVNENVFQLAEFFEKSHNRSEVNA